MFFLAKAQRRKNFALLRLCEKIVGIKLDNDIARTCYLIYTPPKYFGIFSKSMVHKTNARQNHDIMSFGGIPNNCKNAKN